MKTSYVNGNNTFLAYNQDGSLNGIEYVRNRLLLTRHNQWYFQWKNNLNNLLIQDIWVIAADITGSDSILTLSSASDYNGATSLDYLWTKAAQQPSYSDPNYCNYQGKGVDYPMQTGDMLVFSNDLGENLSIRRVMITFEYLIADQIP